MKQTMVSVIIPTFNAEKTISLTLKSLINQKYNKELIDIEILVVNDGSKDKTEEIVQKYININSNIHLINQVNQGPAVARNYGAKMSKGDILLFTDSDCEPLDNWIDEMVSPFLNSPSVQGVKGAYRTKQKELTALFVQYEYEYKYKKMEKFEEIDFIDTYSAGFRKEVFLEHKGYNTNFPVACAEDVELSFRMKNNHVKMIFNPKAIVYHIHPNKAWDYLKKKKKFAYWRMVAVSLNPNFLINDSHTPQLMKLQIPLLGLLGMALLTGVILPRFIWLIILGISLVFYIFSILPFWMFLIKKKFFLLIWAPFLIMMRNLGQGIGIVLYLKDKILKKRMMKN